MNPSASADVDMSASVGVTELFNLLTDQEEETKKLREEERAFVYKHQRMMLDLRRAKFDPSPTYTLLLALRQRLPGEVCSAVVQFLI